MEHFCASLKNLADFLCLNACFLLAYCSGKLYGRAADNLLEYTQIELLQYVFALTAEKIGNTVAHQGPA
jgi:hypothetical protein